MIEHSSLEDVFPSETFFYVTVASAAIQIWISIMLPEMCRFFSGRVSCVGRLADRRLLVVRAEQLSGFACACVRPFFTQNVASDLLRVHTTLRLIHLAFSFHAFSFRVLSTNPSSGAFDKIRVSTGVLFYGLAAGAIVFCHDRTITTNDTRYYILGVCVASFVSIVPFLFVERRNKKPYRKYSGVLAYVFATCVRDFLMFFRPISNVGSLIAAPLWTIAFSPVHLMMWRHSDDEIVTSISRHGRHYVSDESIFDSGRIRELFEDVDDDE